MEISSSISVKSVATINNIQPIKNDLILADKKSNLTDSTRLNLKQIQDFVRRDENTGVILSVPDKALATAIKHINKVISGANIELKHTLHKKTNTVIVTLINKDTNDIILEIPPEKILDAFIERMHLNGLYLDERR